MADGRTHGAGYGKERRHSAAAYAPVQHAGDPAAALGQPNGRYCHTHAGMRACARMCVYMCGCACICV